eukprot:555182-Lingulodinium_polyedra.AAC.1
MYSGMSLCARVSIVQDLELDAVTMRASVGSGRVWTEVASRSYCWQCARHGPCVLEHKLR